MRNSILYIVGAVVILGGSVFLFLKSRKTKDEEKLAEIEVEQEKEIAKAQTVAITTEKPISADNLIAVAKLKDEIISDINKRNSYKKASSRANVQSAINKKLETLKGFGFGMDTNNQLIKIK